MCCAAAMRNKNNACHTHGNNDTNLFLPTAVLTMAERLNVTDHCPDEVKHSRPWNPPRMSSAA